jgi:hypothetical protein
MNLFWGYDSMELEGEPKVRIPVIQKLILLGWK